VPSLAAALRQEGLTAQAAASLAAEIQAELAACQADPFLTSRLRPDIPQAASEWLLEDRPHPGAIRRGVIDHLSFDGQDWWLLDYKTSRPAAGEDWEAFIQRETEKYRHQLLAYREMFDRDEARLKGCLERINVMPLGSAALAGAGLPLDRKYVAKLLKFPRLSENSMDAVSDRDFVAEFIFDAGLLMMHMSRLCEDLILWASDEFRFAEISDAFTTGSSIMPQKKNPDVAELIRGKTGRVYGNLVSILTVLKGLPMSYNRDLQEDKEPLFDTVDTVKASLAVLAAMIGNLTFRRERMKEAAAGGYSTATDIADYLVRKGVPFRRAHAVTGRIVGDCLEKGRGFSDLSLAEFRKFHPALGKDIFRVITVESSVSARQGPGGTSKKQVVKRIRDIESQEKK